MDRMVPQARARDTQAGGQVSGYGDGAVRAVPVPGVPVPGVPQDLPGAVAVAAYAQRRAYDRIVLGMDPAATQCAPALTGPRIAPKATGLFGLLWC
jgi:hypothetical protein